MFVVQIILALAAIYCGGAYIALAALIFRGRYEPTLGELHTFHLGLCFILAVGFFGLTLGH